MNEFEKELEEQLKDIENIKKKVLSRKRLSKQEREKYNDYLFKLLDKELYRNKESKGE